MLVTYLKTFCGKLTPFNQAIPRTIRNRNFCSLKLPISKAATNTEHSGVLCASCTHAGNSGNNKPWHYTSIGYTSQKCYFRTSSKSSIFEDKDTKAITLWSDLKQLRSSPVPALTLGLSGLLPFVAAPALMISSSVYFADIALAQLAYGACILSFIGGIRWGFTIPEDNPVQPDWVNLIYSVTPPLIAWGGLLVPAPMSIITVMGGLVFAGYCDMAMYGYPPWFKGLRFLLTFVALLSLWTTYMCKFMLENHNSWFKSTTTEKES